MKLSLELSIKIFELAGDIPILKMIKETLVYLLEVSKL